MGTVRKVSELKSFGELSLSSLTRECLERRGGDQQIDELMRVARILSLFPDGNFAMEPKWKQELYEALDEAGFIRHDLYPMSTRAMLVIAACMLEQMVVLILFRQTPTFSRGLLVCYGGGELSKH